MDAPQRAAAAVRGKGKARAVQPLGHVARLIYADEEERNAQHPRLVERGQPVGDLFEAGAELAAERLDVIAARLHRAGEAVIGHQDCRRAVRGQRAAHQAGRGGAGEVLGPDDGGDLRAQRRIGDVRGDLERAAGGVERVVYQQLFVVPVIAAQCVHHHVRRQESHAHAGGGAQPFRRAAGLGDLGGNFLRAGVDAVEVVALAGDEPACFRHRIGRAGRIALFGQRALFLGIGAMQPQQRLAHTWKAGGEVRDFQRGQVDIGKDRVAQHIGQAAGVIVAVLARKLGQVELVALGEAQQQVRGQRALVAFEQGDIAGGNAQVARHRLLGQPQFTAQALQARAKVKGAGFGHAGHSVISAQLYKGKL